MDFWKTIVNRKHWIKDEVFTTVGPLKSAIFYLTTRITARNNIFLAFRMLQLLKAVTFGKELLIFPRVFQMSIRLL